MKVYWLIGPVWGMPGHKCFFRMTREEAQEEVDCRMNEECMLRYARKEDGTCPHYMDINKEPRPYTDEECKILAEGTREQWKAIRKERRKSLGEPGGMCPMKPGFCKSWQIEDWHVLEEEIPDKKMGWCDNDNRFVLGSEPQCSVGMVREIRGKMRGGGCRNCTSYVHPAPKAKPGETVCLTKIGRKQFRIVFAKGNKMRAGPLNYEGKECWEYKGAGYDNSKSWAIATAKMLCVPLTYAIPNPDDTLSYVSGEEFDRIVAEESSKGNREEWIRHHEEMKERLPEYAEKYDRDIEAVRASPDCPFNYIYRSSIEQCWETCGPDRMTCWWWKENYSTMGERGHCHLIEYYYQKTVDDWGDDDDDDEGIEYSIYESYHIYRRRGDKNIQLINIEKRQNNIKGDRGADRSETYERQEIDYSHERKVWKFIESKIRDDGFSIDHLGRME